MSDAPNPPTPTLIKRTGPIAWMAQNGVAANLLMAFLILGGIGMSFLIKREVMPDSTLDVVRVRVAYPGSSPAEVEKGILLPVEESVRGLAGVKEVTSTARENSGTVSIELTNAMPRDRGLNRVNEAVDSIQTFPDEAEEPSVSLAGWRRDVLDIRLTGEASYWSLRRIGERVRDRLADAPGVTQVQLEFSPDFITHVEIPQRKLRAHGLTLQMVADRIREASDDVPGGKVETAGGKMMLRVKERKEWAREFASIPIITNQAGSTVRLSDLANLRDGFEEKLLYSEYSGKPTLELGVYRTGEQTPLEVEHAVKEAMKSIGARLPAGISYKITDNSAESYRDRLSLLLKNGLIGLILVLAVLGIFLQYRLAMWVTVGMFTSFIGSLLFLPMLDMSINMISMFAFLIALGIVVDDAIVIGENVYEYQERGMSPMDAAIQGARDIAVPVTFGILTNCVAFAPLLFIPGGMGLIWATVPVVVITVFLISLIEALFILPAHLGHTEMTANNPVSRFFHRRQQRFSLWFRAKVAIVFRPVLDVCVEHRYVTIAIALALFTAVGGYAMSDRMAMVLMPRVPSREFGASAELPSDVTDAKARHVADQLTHAATQVIDHNGGKALAEGVKSNVYGSHVSVDVVMSRQDQRPLSLAQFEQKWRDKAGPIPEANSLSFEMEGGFGFWRPDITVDLSHPRIETLNHAARALQKRLAAYQVTSDVNDSYEKGSPRLDFKVNDTGRALGFTPRMIGRQVRNAFRGAEAKRFLRGPNEVRVLVKLPDNEQDSEYDVQNLMLRIPGGGGGQASNAGSSVGGDQTVPLSEVASVTTGSTYQSIDRRNGGRIVTVSSDVEPKREISRMMSTLREKLLPQLVDDFPGLTWSFQGQQVQMRESLSALFIGLLLALLTIYAMLAIPFKSYIQPLIVMTAIPFGAFGAIVGHMLLGYNLSLLSLMGIVGLSGVVVNDSLIMVDYANRLRAQSDIDSVEAIKQAGVRRFRPILLTTLTTFGGLAPIILEDSRQARFLIPMAISLGFGILFATAIILVIVPCFYMMIEDTKRLGRKYLA